MESFKNCTFLGKKQFCFLKDEETEIHPRSRLLWSRGGGPGSLGWESWGPRLSIRSLVNVALEVSARWRGHWGQCWAVVPMLLACPAAECRRPPPWDPGGQGLDCPSSTPAHFFDSFKSLINDVTGHEMWPTTLKIKRIQLIASETQNEQIHLMLVSVKNILSL